MAFKLNWKTETASIPLSLFAYHLLYFRLIYQELFLLLQLLRKGHASCALLVFCICDLLGWGHCVQWWPEMWDNLSEHGKIFKCQNHWSLIPVWDMSIVWWQLWPSAAKFWQHQKFRTQFSRAATTQVYKPANQNTTWNDTEHTGQRNISSVPFLKKV